MQRRQTATGFRAVDDVVMDQNETMQQLQAGRDRQQTVFRHRLADAPGTGGLENTMRHEEKQRAQTFAWAAHELGHILV